MPENIRGRDVSAPMDCVVMDGVTYPMVFSNQAARIAEDIYERGYGRDIGYEQILIELAKRKYRAQMALFYGAIVAGGAKLSWETFDANFKIDQIPGVREILERCIQQSLPVEDPDEPEDPEANPTKTPTES